MVTVSPRPELIAVASRITLKIERLTLLRLFDNDQQRLRTRFCEELFALISDDPLLCRVTAVDFPTGTGPNTAVREFTWISFVVLPSEGLPLSNLLARPNALPRVADTVWGTLRARLVALNLTSTGASPVLEAMLSDAAAAHPSVQPAALPGNFSFVSLAVKGTLLPGQNTQQVLCSNGVNYRASAEECEKEFPDPPSSAGLSGGVIAGIVIGCILGPLLALGSVCLVVYIRQKRHEHRQREGDAGRPHQQQVQHRRVTDVEEGVPIVPVAAHHQRQQSDRFLRMLHGSGPAALGHLGFVTINAQQPPAYGSGRGGDDSASTLDLMAALPYGHRAPAGPSYMYAGPIDSSSGNIFGGSSSAGDVSMPPPAYSAAVASPAGAVYTYDEEGAVTKSHGASAPVIERAPSYNSANVAPGAVLDLSHDLDDGDHAQPGAAAAQAAPPAYVPPPNAFPENALPFTESPASSPRSLDNGPGAS